jgi:hypothetical protein
MKRLIFILVLALSGLSMAVAQTESTPDVTTEPSKTPENPSSDKPVADTPSTDKPVADKPAADQPTTDKPTKDKPKTDLPAPQKPETELKYEPIRKGDQFIKIDLGFGKSLFYIAPEGIITDTNLLLGGTASIGYSRFITNRIALGGEMSFSFNTTIGSNLLFYLPLTFKGTYEMVFNRIHVPISLGAGFAFQTHNHNNYFGPIIKPELGCYYQFNPEWTIGLLTAWNFIPEWYNDSSYNRIGNILDIKAGIRYHF